MSSSREAEIPAAEEKAESNTLLRRLEEQSEQRVSITLISTGFNLRAEDRLNRGAAWAMVNLRAEK